MDTSSSSPSSAGSESTRPGSPRPHGTDADSSGSIERIPLASDRQLVVRVVEPSDADALSALYEGLDDRDRYHRFFGGYRPPPAFFQRLASLPTGGARVIAEVHAGDGSTIVGEAGYVPIANGNGELAMAVAKPWRGWLGSYLIARLRQAAARNGVPNLEADVLIANGAMLAVLRSFGSVIIGHDGWNALRLRIGTDGMASWPIDHRRPCVLVEATAGRWRLEDPARAAGIDVVTCRGPRSNRACPALDGALCPLVDGADAVIVLDRGLDESLGTVVDTNRRLRPSVPMYVDRRDDERSPQTVEELVDGLRSRDAPPFNGVDGGVEPAGGHDAVNPWVADVGVVRRRHVRGG